MNIPVIPIGNSKGIRLSKTILEKYSIQDSLEIILEEDYIVLKPSTQAREGWDQAFKKMNEEGDDPEKYVYWYTLTPYTPVQ